MNLITSTKFWLIAAVLFSTCGCSSSDLKKENQRLQNELAMMAGFRE